MPDGEDKAIKLKGHITWLDCTGETEGGYERFEVTRAVLRNDIELIIDCNCAAPGDPAYVYTISLFRQDALLFSGHYSAGKMRDAVSDRCDCRLYSNGARHACAGIWYQEGEKQYWFGELYPVDSFEDEEPGR